MNEQIQASLCISWLVCIASTMCHFENNMFTASSITLFFVLRFIMLVIPVAVKL